MNRGESAGGHTASRGLNRPRPARVKPDARGTPVSVDGAAVESVREEWLVQDRWWTEEPLCRRYFELIVAGGRNVVVFWDLEADRWYRQRA